MILRRTQSLCPVCLRRLDAVYAREVDDERCITLRKTCPEHGTFSVPVWYDSAPGDAPTPSFAAWTRPKSPSYPVNPRTPISQGCPFDCGLCPTHAQHTCTGLFEVTMRCDMACPICYAGAGEAGESARGGLAPDIPLSVIAAQMDVLKGASGPCNVQISGGEPTVRDDLPAIIGMARQRGFGLVQVNTNGLRLAHEEEYAHKLREAGLDSVYMQWDGVTEEVFAALRGRQCLDFKHRAVQNCARAGLGVVLVATLVRGVNDGQVGDLLRHALALGDVVRGLHMQPAAFFGRYPWRLMEAPRLTLPEVMGALARQAPELVNPAHLHPPGCENELCSFSAVYRRVHGQGVPALEWLPNAGASCCAPPAFSSGATALPTAEDGARKAKQFVALHWKGHDAPCGDNAAQSAPGAEAADGFGRFLAQAGAEQRFTLSAMAFQDSLSLDVARVRGCCIHVVRPDGRMIPFCLHNLTASDGTRLYGIRA